MTEEVTMDGLRVVVTDADGSTTFREPTLGEQVGALAEDVRRQVQGMVPHAYSSAISYHANGDDNVELRIALSRTGQAAFMPNPEEPVEAPAPVKARPPTAKKA